LSLTLLATSPGLAQTTQAEKTKPAPDRPLPPPPPPSDAAAGTEFRPRFLLETGRTQPRPAEADLLRFQIHGEYQARFAKLAELELRRGDASRDTLGQTTRVYHWLRVTPRFQVSDDLEVVAQIDVPEGFFLGQETNFVGAARRPLDERNPFEVEPRWLFVDWHSPIGLFRVGQQPSHWGMGLVANDGDHPTLFGDYFDGSKVERVLFATQPAGKDSPFTIAVAGDLVFEDATARLVDGDIAFQAVLAAFYEDAQQNMLGLYAVYRHQSRDAEVPLGRQFQETLEVLVLDSAGRFNAKVPGTAGHVFGEYEVVYLLGTTDLVRTLEQTRQDEREQIRALGAATRFGAALTSGRGDDRWGSLVFAVEWGWATGDADPNDGTMRRFRFDPNHNVGLLLFDEVLAWKTARAATIAADPGLVARPSPGFDQLPSDGGVFGATYLYPTLVARPLRELDLKAGAVIAQTTADFVDPVGLALHGRFQNYDAGNPKGHDLGLELDAGFEYRLELDPELTLELGGQAGVFFPGNAFADETGSRLDTQWIAVGRLGIQY
jgi:hypothetical protein